MIKYYKRLESRAIGFEVCGQERMPDVLDIWFQGVIYMTIGAHQQLYLKKVPGKFGAST